TVDTPLYRAVLSTHGAALKSFTLKNYRKSLAKDAEPIEMVQLQPGMPLPLEVSFPSSTVDGGAGVAFDTAVKSLDLTSSGENRSLVFTRTIPGAIKVEKAYTFNPAKYAFDLEVRVYNLSDTPISQNASLNWHQYVDPKAETDSYAHDGPITYVGKDIDRQEVKKLEAEKTLGPGVLWSGFESKYFIAAMLPQNPSLTSVAMAKDPRHLVSVSLRGPKNIIPPGQAGVYSYTLYIGPKDYTLLKAQGLHLEEAIDFGSWLKWLAMPLLIILKFLYGYVHNYGIAIIILTILIKIIFWPLGNKSYESMKEMQKIQPKLQELREKYKNDRQRLSQETMALYRAHKVNPMGGCLPMLIQIPVFFGLYKTLLYAIELRHSPFFWWIKDLSDKDPYYITPIIMGGTMWIQQKMTPMGGDPMQQKVMLWMPVIFTFLFLNFPSGLVIYWLFNNILSIGQQYYINKRYQ
ncbi:MAG: membrane protein insertase YidC, partial [Syntrophales bacterium]|nr:membrane protein insertase YidC [Syntrophales bacterium]